MSRPAPTPFAPTQSGLSGMAAERFSPEIAHALAGLHPRGGAAWIRCLPPRTPRLTRRTEARWIPSGTSCCRPCRTLIPMAYEIRAEAVKSWFFRNPMG